LGRRRCPQTGEGGECSKPPVPGHAGKAASPVHPLLPPGAAPALPNFLSSVFPGRRGTRTPPKPQPPRFSGRSTRFLQRSGEGEAVPGRAGAAPTRDTRVFPLPSPPDPRPGTPSASSHLSPITGPKSDLSSN